MTESLTPAAEREALEGLLLSEGWRVYYAAMQDRWSAEQYEQEVRKVYAEAAPGDDMTSVIAQINATYAGMRAMLGWPKERIRTLSGVPEKSAGHPFEHFLRRARRA